MRTLYPLLMLPLLALAALVAWPRASASTPRAEATYTVARLSALLARNPNAVRGRIVAVQGYYHYGCPYCLWIAPPSLTMDSSWSGPSIVVALPDRAYSRGEAWWVVLWRRLPLLDRLAPPPALPGPLEGPITFTGTIATTCPPSISCAGPLYAIHVLNG